MEADIPNDGCKIIYCYWTKFSKYRVLSMATRSIICRSLRLRHIIDLQDTNKSRYFGITEFNNFFIIQSSSFFFFDKFLREAAIFTQERLQEGEKRDFIYT